MIVFGGMLGLLASLGLGRFSLGMMLPGMGEGLGLSYAQMGLISTINFCGYLAAVIACGRLSAIMGARLLIFLGLLLVSGSMVLVGLSTSLPIIILLYCCTGIGSAFANVPIMALVSAWFEPNRRGRATGLCVMGNGLGILLSGQVVPFFSETGQSWRASWLVLGGLVLLIAFICLALLRNKSVENTRQNVQKEKKSPRLRSESRPENDKKRFLLHCAALYFLFGFTYVIYITFIVTSLVEERGITEYAAGKIWSLVGVISLGSGPLLGYFSDKAGRKRGLILVFSMQTASYLLIAMQLPLISVYFSIVLYGLVAFSIPTIIAALVGDYVGPDKMAGAFGFVTFIFGIGQIVGPAIAGSLAEQSGSFSTSFFLAASLAFVAVILSIRLPARSK